METLGKIREAINFLTYATKEGSNAADKSVKEWMKYLEVLIWELDMDSAEDDLSDVEFPDGYFDEFSPEAKLLILGSAIRLFQRVVNNKQEGTVV